VWLISYDISREWETLAEKIVEPNQVILVIGKVDVGKSTLCRFLADEGVKRGLVVGLVDADVGQSWIGPPTTIGMKLVKDSTEELKKEPDALYFAGWISPERHLLQTVIGAKKMVDAAIRGGAELVVVDTTGLVEGGMGSVLKLSKVELICPQHLVFIQQKRELELLINSVQNVSAHQIHQLVRSKSVTKKSREYRRHFRSTRFDEYFADCVVSAIPLSQIRGQRTQFFNGKKATAKELENLSNLADDRILYAEWAYRSLSIVSVDRISGSAIRRICNRLSVDNLNTDVIDNFEQRLVALLDEKGNVLSLGIVQNVNFGSGILNIKCKNGIAQSVKVIQFGDYKMGQNGAGEQMDR